MLCPLPPRGSLLLYLDHPSAISVDSSSSGKPSFTLPSQGEEPGPQSPQGPRFLHQSL